MKKYLIAVVSLWSLVVILSDEAVLNLPALRLSQAMADDDYFPADSSFGAAPFRRPEDMRPTPFPDAPDTWADVGHGFLGSMYDVGAGLSAAAHAISSPEQRQAWEQKIADLQSKAQEERAQITPGVEPGWGHKTLWLGEQIPQLGALAGAAAAGSAVGGPAGGAAAAGTMMGAMSAGDVANRLRAQGIEPTSEQLAKAATLGFIGGAILIGLPIWWIIYNVVPRVARAATRRARALLVLLRAERGRRAATRRARALLALLRAERDAKGF
jgi:hypothetical protein